MTTLSRPPSGQPYAAYASALGIGLGYLADQRWGDPRRGHPVAGFGRLATAVERVSYADSRAAGIGYATTLVGAAVGLGLALRSVGRRHPLLEVILTATATWAVLGGRSLRREAGIIASQLGNDDLAAARQQIRNLVGRDPSQLDAGQLARACVESVAENTSDAVIAPLCWGAVAGIPGLLGYRAVNTLDAMVGHRSPRYLRFGWAAARLDDVVNWVPARLAGALAAGCAPLVGGSPRAAAQAVRSDAGQHPSPNAGVVEAAYAGALGVRLGGRNVYGGRVEERGTLGRGRAVQPRDIARANTLSLITCTVAAALAVGIRAAVRHR